MALAKKLVFQFHARHPPVKNPPFSISCQTLTLTKILVFQFYVSINGILHDFRSLWTATEKEKITNFWVKTHPWLRTGTDVKWQTVSTRTATLSSPPLSTALWEPELRGQLEGRMQLHHRCSMQCTRHLARVSLRSASFFFYFLFQSFPSVLSSGTVSQNCMLHRQSTQYQDPMHGGQNNPVTVDKTMLGLLQSAHASVQQRQCWAYCKAYMLVFNKDNVGLTAKRTRWCSTKTMLGLLQSAHARVQQAVLHNQTAWATPTSVPSRTAFYFIVENQLHSFSIC